MKSVNILHTNNCTRVSQMKTLNITIKFNGNI